MTAISWIQGHVYSTVLRVNMLYLQVSALHAYQTVINALIVLHVILVLLASCGKKVLSNA